jgi:hypothetical protein
MTATALWAAVVASYDADGLLALTNIRDRTATAINATVGQSAAQAVIDLWPAYAQESYDAANPLHVEVGKRATIAVLWSRGGTSAEIARVEWAEVFGDGGMVEKVRNTGARARVGPVTNSGIQPSRDQTIDGRPVRGWSDPASLPAGFLPRSMPSD